MKKTYNINISGYGFVIDEDAYDILNCYLTTLSQICEKANQRETATDIEQRIAEIFTEKFTATGARIINRADVEEVIERMGSPEEIVEVEIGETDSRETVKGPTPPPFVGGPIKKRLYRDISNKMLGGVCSGIGWYLGVDVVWIRLIMVALAFLSGSTMVLIYIVLWLVVPAAKTPYERMQMMGMDSSVSNVGKVVTGDFNSCHPGHENGFTPAQSRSASSSSNIGKIIMMIFVVLGLLVVGSILFALSLGFIGCLIAICVIPGNAVYTSSVTEAKLILGCVTGGCLVVGIPLFLLFRVLLSTLTEQSYPPFNLQQRIFIFIPWLLGVAACIVCGILLGHLS